MKRRFLLALLLPLAVLSQSAFEKEFTSPPPRYAPSAFWWWFGAPYSAADIRSGLDAMKAAGLGGFRISPIYAFPGAPEGHRYLSPGYLSLVREAVTHGKTIGLTPEALLGTGWPFGGPYIPPQMGAQQLQMHSQEVEGGPFSGALPGDPGVSELVAVLAARPSAAGLVLESVVDLSAKAAGGRLEWDAPPGRWRLMSFVARPTGMKVKRAAPGGEGLVLDHFRRDALDLHLKHNGDVQAPYLSGALAVTVDSWEVFGANWTPALEREFERRRGYSLRPYLPALFLPSGETGARARYDFRRTVSELALENFFVPLRDWAHSRGFRTRWEAHGTPADILEAYGVADAPEAESYGEQDRRAINVRDRRLASSAGHLFGRRQISSETFTWLRYPLFLTTLEQMKGAADASYLDGINHINYHGVPLSPASADPPGFYYYAATSVSPGNTWWPYLHLLSDYLRRTNFLLQQGEPVADVAVYLPYEDVWSEAYGPWYDLAGALEKHLREGRVLGALMALEDGGYKFDFIHAEALARAGFADGRLAAGPMRYRVLMLPPMEAVEPRVLEAAKRFCDAGGAVVALDRLPVRSAGLRDAEGETQRVRALTREIFPEAGRTGCGILLEADPAQALMPGTHSLPRAVSRVVQPDFVPHAKDPETGFVHRRSGDEELYFIANLSAREKRFEGRFRAQGVPRLLDAETGIAQPAWVFRREGEHTVVDLKLSAWGSTFVVFARGSAPHAEAHDTDAILSVSPDGLAAEAAGSANGTYFVRTRAGTLRGSVDALPAPFIIGAPWKLAASTQPAQELGRLANWASLPGWEAFSGTATYTTEFVLPETYLQAGSRLELDLGGVHEIAEVRLNGVHCGVAWKAPYVLRAGSARAGRNRLEVKVTNRLINRMRQAKPLPPPYPDLRDRVPAALPSGLLGPVRLRALRTFQLRSSP